MKSEAQKLFTYWVRERENIRLLKQQKSQKPWSKDPIFQNTYFCNVRREDDKVTKYVRKWSEPLWSPSVVPTLTAYLVLARMFNWPDTLSELPLQKKWSPAKLMRKVKIRREQEKQVFNGAYLITTCGVKMDKIDYVFNVASEVYHQVDPHPSCEDQWVALQEVNGLGSFLAAQIVADLKNTSTHPLNVAEDWHTFVAPGPGSIRGMNYFFGIPPAKSLSLSEFRLNLPGVRAALPDSDQYICNQDLQNCLCEYSKYMRVKEGGRTKRTYNGV